MSSVKQVTKDLAGIKKDDGAVVSVAKVMLPVATFGKVKESFSDSKHRIENLAKDAFADKDTVGALSFSEAVVRADMEPEVLAFNVKRLLLISRIMLGLSFFIFADGIIFLAFGFYVALFSIPSALLIFILAAKYAFFAYALKHGEFSHKRLLYFIFDRKTKWISSVFIYNTI